MRLLLASRPLSSLRLELPFRIALHRALRTTLLLQTMMAVKMEIILILQDPGDPSVGVCMTPLKRAALLKLVGMPFRGVVHQLVKDLPTSC